MMGLGGEMGMDPAAAPPGAPGGGSGAAELITLRDKIGSHEEMFRVLGAIMRRYDDVAKAAASNRR